MGSDNVVYVSKTASNTNHDPAGGTDTTNWRALLDTSAYALTSLSNILSVPAAADGSVKNGPDVVVAHYIASDGSSWYRKYKSGWVEQGGVKSLGQYTQSYLVTLPLQMSSSSYFTSASAGETNGHNVPIPVYCRPSSTTQALIGNDGTDTHTVYWTVRGISA
jgi:hypothetical protein